MNKKQKIILIIFIFILVTMILFPPTYTKENKKHNDIWYYYEYTFIFTLFSCMSNTQQEILINLYVFQLVIVSMIFGLLYLINKD